MDQKVQIDDPRVFPANIVGFFTPLPKQKVFMYHVEENPEARFVWYCGGFGSGKSYIGSRIIERMAMQAPFGRSLIARQTLVDLKATTLKTFFEVVDPRLIASYNKTENLITLINGHEIYTWGLDDIEKLKSLEIGLFWVDEVNEVDENVFNVLKGRLRNKRHPRRVGFITSNSEGKNWTYKQFVSGKGIRSDEDLKRYFVVKAPSTENIYLPPDYLETLNSYTGDLYERYVRASFDVFEGQIFPEFNAAGLHVIRPFKLPPTWKRIAAIDHGERNPTAITWAAISPMGDIYVYRDYSVAEKYVHQHAEEMAKLTENEELWYILIDPSVKSVRGYTGRKVDKEWLEGIRKHMGDHIPLRFAKNDVQAGIARLHKYLRIDKTRQHTETGLQGAPRLYIFDTCKQVIDDFENYRWKKINPNNENDPEEKPRKKDDHNIDTVRYIVMSRPDFEHGTVVNGYEDDDSLKAVIRQEMKQIGRISEKTLLQNAIENNPEDFEIPR